MKNLMTIAEFLITPPAPVGAVGPPSWQEKGWGKWAFSVSVKQYSRETGKVNKDHGIQRWIGFGENVEAAKREVLSSSSINQYWAGPNSQYGTPKFVVTGIEVLNAPNKNSPAYREYINKLSEGLDALGKSADVLEALSKLNAFKKYTSKVPVAGKVIQAVDIANDLLKFEDAIDRYKKAASKEAKAKVAEDFMDLFNKAGQTAATAALPPLAFAEIANTAMGAGYDYCKKTLYENALKDKAKVAKKDEYDKQSWALKPSDDGYKIEVLAYMNGATKADLDVWKKVKNVYKFAKIVYTANPIGKFMYDWFWKEWETRF
jgi:tetratricopeptide (TPR) repeat protein